MGFFDEAIKKLDDLSQEVGKTAINAVAEVNKHIPPSTFQSLENFGEEAGKHVGITADDVWKALLGAGPTAEDVWKKLDVLGQGAVVEDAKKFEWDAAVDVKSWILKHPGQTAAYVKSWMEKNPGQATADVKSWIAEHQGQAAGILAGILAPPLAMAAVPVILGGLGFTVGGAAAGSIAAGAQAAVGTIATRSLFSVLQSAAMGGSTALVNGVLGGTVAVAAVGANVPVIIEAAVNEGKAEAEGKEKNSKR